MFWPYIEHIYIIVPAVVWKFLFRDSRMKKRKGLENMITRQYIRYNMYSIVCTTQPMFYF